MSKDWKDQLQKIKDDLNRKEDPTLAADEESAQVMKDMLTSKCRLLKDSEDVGIITAPILITRYFLRRMGWRTLEQTELCKKIHGEYLLLETKLLGVSETWLAKNGLQPLDGITKSYGDMKDTISQYATCGQVRHKGSHYYAPLVSRNLVRNNMLAIHDWDFASGVLERVPELGLSMDTLIKLVPKAFLDIHVT